MLQKYEEFQKKADELEDSIAAFESSKNKCKNIQKEISDFTRLKEELYKQYHHKLGMIIKTEKRLYTRQEINEIRRELADRRFSTLIKRFFGLGKSKEEIYGELMGKLGALIDYLEEELATYTNTSEQEKAALEEIALEYESSYLHIKRDSGNLFTIDHSEYEQVKQIGGCLYLCDINRQLEEEVSFSKEILEKNMSSTYKSGSIILPYTFSFYEALHLLYECNSNTISHAYQSVRSLIYQMLRMTPAYFVEMHFMDGEKTGSEFRELLDLKKIRKNGVFSLNQKVTHHEYKMAQIEYMSESAIVQGLRMLEKHMMTVAGQLGQYDTLAAYNAANGGRKGNGFIPYQLVVIHNFPVGFQEESIKLLDELIRNGNKCGISVIVVDNQDKWKQEQRFRTYGNQKTITLRDRISKESYEILDQIRIAEREVNIIAEEVSSECNLLLMKEGRPEYIDSIIQTKMTEEEIDNYFPNVIDMNAHYGQLNATAGLRIPFAIANDARQEIMEYQLGEALNAHGLICGGTGSGKSTLLHMLISSIVMNYRPEDVEIWLSDYKITEFNSYKTNTPPHIRFIGLSKTSDYSYAFIDKIYDEMTRRQMVIADANVTDFKQYRETRGLRSMTRLIVIVDEFHVMAQHAYLDPVYKERLENLLSEARAFGIILLFSDQAIEEGLRGLTVKGKNQIKARIALANTKEELKATLVGQSPEELKQCANLKRGEAAIQTVFKGKDEDGFPVEKTQITRGLVIYIDDKWRQEVCLTARSLYGAENYEADVFDDREVIGMDLEEIQIREQSELSVHRDGSRDLQIYLGRPVNLKFSMNFSLLQRKGNNMMSVAGTELQQMQIVNAVVASFKRQQEYEIVFMTDPYAGLYREYGPDIRKMVNGNSNISLYEDLDSICYQVNRLLGVMRNRGNQKKILVVWLGLDTIADLLGEESSRKPEALKAAGFPAQTSSKAKESIEEKVSSSLDALDSLFQDLYGDDTDTEDDPYAEQETEIPENSCIYNAGDDIGKLIHMGPTCNIYHLVIYDSSAALKDFRGVKASDFIHKIAFVMSDNEASDFLERSNLIRGMSDHMAYYYNGRYGNKFIPYKI